MTNRTRFQQLFDGTKTYCGLWLPPVQGGEDRKGSVTSYSRYPMDAEWETHLAGAGVGIGVCPIREDSTSVWGVLDFDYDDLADEVLLEKIHTLQLPLYLCKTRSDRQHLYLFSEEPGRRTAYMKRTLEYYKAALGYEGDPKVEVWPSQPTLNAEGRGQWINLPYYGETRQCITKDGPLTLSEFLDTVRPIPMQEAFTLPLFTPSELQQSPPCLSALVQEGLPSGERHRGLFNYAVLLNKMDKPHFQERMQQLNEQLCSPLYSPNELKQTLNAVKNKGYEYRCTLPPINAHCDRAACEGRTYGIGNANQSEERASFAPFAPTKLMKQLSDPPVYFLQFQETVWVMIKSEFFWNNKRVWEACCNRMNCVFDPAYYIGKGQQKWLMLASELHKTMEIRQAPLDSSTPGQVQEYLWLFLQSKMDGDVEQLLRRGKVIVSEGYVWFNLLDFNEHIMRNRLVRVQTQELWVHLSDAGCEYEQHTLKGKPMSLAKIRCGLVKEPQESLTKQEPLAEKEEFA